MSLVLYAGEHNSVSIASHILLEDLQLAYELRRLNYASVEQRSPAYLKVNPKGRVPALATDEGILTETPAILTWLALQKPESALIPEPSSFAFARLQSFMAYLCSTVHPAHAHRVRGYRWSDDPAVIEGLKLKVPQNMADCFTLIEQNYLDGDWVMGETYTIADPYLFAIAQWMESDGVDPTRFAKVSAHRNRMLACPQVQRALAAYTPRN